MIPPFDTSDNLPRGVHDATWQEFVDRFGRTEHRQNLISGLKSALESLRDAGCQRVYIDGSFVSAKDIPSDFDACWEVVGVDPNALDPVLLVFDRGRAAQKAKFKGELFPAQAKANPIGTAFLDFFQQDGSTGDPKGIIALDPQRLGP